MYLIITVYVRSFFFASLVFPPAVSVYVKTRLSPTPPPPPTRINPWCTSGLASVLAFPAMDIGLTSTPSHWFLLPHQMLDTILWSQTKAPSASAIFFQTHTFNQSSRLWRSDTAFAIHHNYDLFFAAVANFLEFARCELRCRVCSVGEYMAWRAWHYSKRCPSHDHSSEKSFPNAYCRSIRDHVWCESPWVGMWLHCQLCGRPCAQTHALNV